MSENISTSKELAKLLKEDGDFRDNFEKYLWEVVVESVDLYGQHFYRIYYDLSEQRFRRYLFSKTSFKEHQYVKSNDWIPPRHLINVVDVGREIWEELCRKCDMLLVDPEYDWGDDWDDDWEENGIDLVKLAEREIKSDYIEETVDLIIKRLE